MRCLRRIRTQEDAKSGDIEKTIREDMRVQLNTMKILLLGTGDAGKSTFCKQMTVIHSDIGTKPDELSKFADILRDNTISSMHTILMAAHDWELMHNPDAEQRVSAIMNAHELTPEIAEDVAFLAETDVVRTVMDRSSELQLPGGGSGGQYFLEHCKRFAEPDFLPTEEDIVRAKLRSTGINEITFTVQNTQFRLVDVGGQRTERRKWIHCFGDVNAVLYLCAINEYDMVLEEDNKTNRLEESLKLFESLTGSIWLQNTPFILFLNKTDLFVEKIKRLSLDKVFVDYESFAEQHAQRGTLSAEDMGVEYIQSLFSKAFCGTNRLYMYKTCAIDRNNCAKVFKAVRDSVLSSLLTEVGL